MKPSTKTLTNKPFLYGKKEFTVEKLEAAIAAYEFKDQVSVDALYDVLNKHLEGLSPFPFEDANELQKFRANMAIFLYNEEGDTEGNTVAYYKDKGLLAVPTSVSKPELALTDKLLELTRGVDSEENKLAIIVRILAFFYAFTSFDIPPFVFMAAALSIRSVDELEKHLNWIASKKKLVKEVKDTSENNEPKDELNGQPFKVEEDISAVEAGAKVALEHAAEIAKRAEDSFKDTMQDIQEAIEKATKEVEEQEEKEESSSTSSRSSSTSWGDVALYGLGLAAVGVGAYYVMSNFMGSAEEDVELLPVAAI